MSINNQLGITSLKAALLGCSSLLMLTACQHHKPVMKSSPTHRDGPPPFEVDVRHIKNAVPKHEPLSRYGNPKTYRVKGRHYKTMSKSEGYRAKGVASWYGTKFHNQKTSSGEPYNMFAMTAAHKTLPLPTYARVTNLANRREIIVKINDRGPFHQDRLIDLSYVAAKKLGISGTAMVEIAALNPRRFGPSSMPRTQWRSNQSYDLPRPYHTPMRSMFLQLGAFQQKPNAERFANRVKQIVSHERVQLAQSTMPNQAMYRVRIGPFKDLQQANKVHSALRSAGLGQIVKVRS